MHRGVTFTNLQWRTSPSSPSLPSVTFTNIQWGYSPSSPSSPSVTFTNLQCVLHRVHRSVISSEASHQVHPVMWRSQIYSVCFIKCDFYKFTIHWSLLRLLQVHHSRISTATSTSAPITNLHCNFYQCSVHQSPLLRCYSCTILQWISIYYCAPQANWPHHSLCTVLVSLCSCH